MREFEQESTRIPNHILFIWCLGVASLMFFSGAVHAAPSTVDSPVSGDEWAERQHVNDVDGNLFLEGVGGANDRFAFDLNLGGGNFDLGQPVYAVESGEIYIGDGWGGSSVGQLLINHTTEDGEWSTGYLHMPDDRVRSGFVNKGDLIGRVGCVGLTCSLPFTAHLHFAVYDTHGRAGLQSVDVNIVARTYGLNENAPTYVLGGSSPENIFPGDSLPFSAIWTDVEGDQIEAVTVRFRRLGSLNWASRILLYTGLSASGETFGLRVTDLPTTVGTYEYEFRASDNGSPLLTSDWVPSGTFNINDRVVAPTDDFFVESSNIAPSSSLPGGVVRFTTIQSYEGTSSDRLDSTFGYYLSNDNVLGSDDVLLGTDSSGLDTGDLSDNESFNYTVPVGAASGNFYILFVADHLNQHEETNEQNNVEAIAFEIQEAGAEAGDFYVDSSEVAPSSSLPGDLVRFTTIQRYEGTSTDRIDSSFGYYLSNDNVLGSDDILLGTDSSSLDAGDLSDDESFNYTVPVGAASGNFYILFVADHLNQHEETNEQNNVEAIEFEILVPNSNSGDFFMRDSRVQPEIAFAGQVIDLATQHAYMGDFSANIRARMGYYLSTDSVLSANDLLINEDLSTFRSSSDANFETHNFVSPNTLQPGQYYILFVADYLNEHDEENEENNVEAVQITVSDVDVDRTVETSFVSSCLAGKGRVDLNIVNTETASSVYTLNFGPFTRQRTVAFENWARIPITGRPAGNYDVSILRDGAEIYNETLTINCNDQEPTVSAPEVTFVNACIENSTGAVNGFVLFQMVNPSNASKLYVIEFEGVNNRATSAAAFGQTVRGTAGRPDGLFDYRVRTGSTLVDNGTVEVDCD